MTKAEKGIVLTGATGFLGRYLLRELLRTGHHVAVLVRESRAKKAEDRAAEVLAFANETPGGPFVPPEVVIGDLRLPGLGLDANARRRLAAHGHALIHAAARLDFQPTIDGEPWATNVEGTQHLLDLCASLGVTDFHHISTAFVCGDRMGTVLEAELDCGQGFHNSYEASKFEAERRVRQMPGLRATIYRPSIIVGDSCTGYTSNYAGIYGCVALLDRLAELGNGQRTTEPRAGQPRRQLSLRLPGTGDELRNLVPVDWVARAIVHLIGQPDSHGRTFHLVAAEPVRGHLLKEVAEELLHLDGLRWAGPAIPPDPNELEALFLDHLQAYGSYFRGEPAFDCRNVHAALSELPPPRINRALLTRLIDFAVADQWGRKRKPRRRAVDAETTCAHYVEHFFPRQVRHSTLARTTPLNLTVSLDIHGPGGGQWSCRWAHGELVEIRRHLDAGARVTYHADAATFAAVVAGRQSAHEAFFEGRIDIAGDLEAALKLAVLFEQFAREFPYHPQDVPEAMDATSQPA